MFFTLYKCGTMSSRPNQGPTHTGTAGLSQPTVTFTPIPHNTQGEVPLAVAELKPGITGTGSTGTGILRPPRFLYNGAKPHQPHPSPRGIPSTPPHPTPPNHHQNQRKSRYHSGSLHQQSWSTGRPNTNPLSIQGEHSPTHNTPTYPGIKPGTAPEPRYNMSRWTTTNPLSDHWG